MSEDAVSITHAEALRLIDEQVGERVHLALFVKRAESESGDEGLMPFIQKTGRLGNPFQDRSPRLEDDIGFYGFGPEGVDAFPLPPLTGATQLRDNGIDFLISDITTIRIAWRGSKEVGDGLDAGKLGRLRILGVAREGDTATDDVSLDLRRFLSEAKRARAEIRSASPTDFSFETKAGEGRRIWKLKVRVIPEDEAAFEATAEVAWPLSETIEEKLENGEFLTGVPVETQALEVAFDQGNREQVMALVPESDGDSPPLRFRGMIVGRSLNSTDESMPS
ncbi:MAG TPA: hypothetical protein VGH58_05470 [Solirubrobacterales bacterium]|jgi:hypothetical protein